MMNSQTKVLVVLSFIFFINANFLKAQPKNILEEGYYVVVAAYAPAKEAYAQRFTTLLSSKDASYGFSPFKNLYFVYLHFDKDFRAALAEMRKLRQDEQFHDAWVYVMGDYEQQEVNTLSKKDEIPVDIQKTAIEKVDVVEPVPAPDKIAEEAMLELREKVVYQEKQKFQHKEKEDLVLGDFLVFFNLFNAANLDDVAGDVQLIDSERASLIDVLPGGNYHTLKDPNNRTGNLLLIADVFGFRKAQKSINYYKPLEDSSAAGINIIADVFVVDFDLVRYHIGDIVTMYNVYFYKDAAIMLPESAYELNQLLAMMNENPGYKIRIHGHVNGRNAGKIITMGEDKEFFQLTDDDEEGFGSAKKLSKERARVIKDYLIEHGIAEERLEIKAWGGRRMLYDKHSRRADQNVRVEIEIMED